MRRVRLRGFLVCGLGVLVACSSVEVIGIDGGLPDGAAPDAAAEGSSDATVKDGATQDQSADQASEGSAEGSPDAVSGDAPGEASDDAGEAGAADSGDAGNPEGSTLDASDDAPGETGSSDEAGAPDAGEGEASSDASPDAPSDAPTEAAACTVAATWSMTVQTITANPTLCQGFLDCTNCDIQSNATSTEPSAGTLDWSNLTPGGTLCNSFTGTIAPDGTFATSETDCSPAGDGTTFDGQIDVATCSMTGTYVYVLSGCTVTFTMTGTQ